MPGISGRAPRADPGAQVEALAADVDAAAAGDQAAHPAGAPAAAAAAAAVTRVAADQPQVAAALDEQAEGSGARARRRWPPGPPRRPHRGAFAARLREQVGPNTLSAELLGIVDQTVQPTQGVAVAARPGDPAPRRSAAHRAAAGPRRCSPANPTPKIRNLDRQAALAVILMVIPLATATRIAPDQPDEARDLSCRDRAR
jgi:hypothetical protein